jgi:hypothetical protein
VPNVQLCLPTDQKSSTQPPMIMVVGKAFFDMGHTSEDHSNRRTDLPGDAAWEIHPVMALRVVQAHARVPYHQVFVRHQHLTRTHT